MRNRNNEMLLKIKKLADQLANQLALVDETTDTAVAYDHALTLSGKINQIKELNEKLLTNQALGRK